jgi:hypothetical protein
VLWAYDGLVLVRILLFKCRKFVKYGAKIRNSCMLQLPSIVTFTLHFGDITKVVIIIRG